MMHNSTLARRYAVALGDLAKEKSALDQVASEMNSIKLLLNEGKLMQLITDQNSTQEAKEQALRSLFTQKVHDITLNFLLLVVHKARAAYLPAIIAEFERYADSMRNVLPVQVTTAAPLDEDIADSLRDRLSAFTGQKVRLEQAIDPRVLGGVKVQIGDKVIDGSVEGRLRRLKAAMQGARFSRSNG